MKKVDSEIEAVMDDIFVLLKRIYEAGVKDGAEEMHQLWYRKLCEALK